MMQAVAGAGQDAQVVRQDHDASQALHQPQVSRLAGTVKATKPPRGIEGISSQQAPRGQPSAILNGETPSIFHPGEKRRIEVTTLSPRNHVEGSPPRSMPAPTSQKPLRRSARRQRRVNSGHDQAGQNRRGSSVSSAEPICGPAASEPLGSDIGIQPWRAEDIVAPGTGQVVSLEPFVQRTPEGTIITRRSGWGTREETVFRSGRAHGKTPQPGVDLFRLECIPRILKSDDDWFTARSGRRRPRQSDTLPGFRQGEIASFTGSALTRSGQGVPG